MSDSGWGGENLHMYMSIRELYKWWGSGCPISHI